MATIAAKEEHDCEKITNKALTHSLKSVELEMKNLTAMVDIYKYMYIFIHICIYIYIYMYVYIYAYVC
jgi:hypothetical protein